ncbi:MAG: class I SAM-dependent methyltransferase [Treponema sp.]|jgi:23S rRNA G2069 N7-methylase RlmK/C1962 C5-methylase RlmI|nr:class I SAM-dependent methyltransferase [Treponema sp.]
METEKTEAEKTAEQAEMLVNRLRKRFRHLSKWAKRTGAGAFRLYDRDIPEIPLLIDFYGDAVAGSLYQRPYEKDEESEERWLAAMKNAAALALSIDPRNIFIRQRKRQRGLAQYEKAGGQGFTRVISEGGLRFRVNLSDYLDTGLFLDRRVMRNMVRQEAAGKRVLNLFCYTASFSVYAAGGNAASTDSVDISNTYLDWAQENFSLNGYHAAIVSMEDFISGTYTQTHRLIRCDALSFPARALAAKKTWDIIVLDPPTFSNSKKMTAVLDLQRDHIELVSRCLALLAPGGTIWFSVNTRHFKTSAAELEAGLAARFPGLRVVDLGGETTDEDFCGKKTPHCYAIQINSLPGRTNSGILR